MDALAWIAEQRIKEAMEEGLFDDLPRGRRIDLDDDAGVPPELRMAYRVLRNSGVLPPELELRQELVTLRGLLAATTEGAEKDDLRRRIQEKALHLAVLLKR